DERVRAALKYAELPHPAYVLGRLSGVDDTSGLEVAHVFPPAPSDTWTGDGTREWADYTEDEQNSHRALAQTLGNLALLEEDLAIRAFDQSFPANKGVFARSAVPTTAELAEIDAWNTAAITARSARLAERFVE